MVSEHTLEDAVLHCGAVKHGNRHMELRRHRIALGEHTGVDLIKIIVAILRTHEYLFGLCHKPVHIAVIAYVEQFRPGIPSSLL